MQAQYNFGKADTFFYKAIAVSTTIWNDENVLIIWDTLTDMNVAASTYC